MSLPATAVRDERSFLLNTSTIVQELWSYCNGLGLGQSLVRSPACEYASARKNPRLTRRDEKNEK